MILLRPLVIWIFTYGMMALFRGIESAEATRNGAAALLCTRARWSHQSCAGLSCLSHSSNQTEQMNQLLVPQSPHVGDSRFFEGAAVACEAWVVHGVTVSTSKVVCGCAIISCRTQVSIERGQDYLVKLVATCLCLSCDQVTYHVPYCPNNT